MPLRDGRSTGEEMKVSALAAGSVASGDPPAPPPLPPAISTQWQKEPSQVLRGLWTSGTQLPGLEGCVTLVGQ